MRKYLENHAVAVGKLKRFFVVIKEHYFSVCICEKKLFGHDSKDSNANISYIFATCSLAVRKGFLQSFWINCHQAAGILMDSKGFFLVFSGQLGLE